GSVPGREKRCALGAHVPEAALDVLPEALRGEPAQGVIALGLDAQARRPPSRRERKLSKEFICSISCASSWMSNSSSTAAASVTVASESHFASREVLARTASASLRPGNTAWKQ